MTALVWYLDCTERVVLGTAVLRVVPACTYLYGDYQSSSSSQTAAVRDHGTGSGIIGSPGMVPDLSSGFIILTVNQAQERQ